ncbi:AAA family ATPase [Ensifer sp. 22460]|uniref:AAA family ATPase n=1 Tax=Ensifer sp. 22460 TaxID=3453922 RepID=UPI003F84D2A1
MSEPELYIEQHTDKLAILDEVHRLTNPFPNLRDPIDRGRRTGKRSAQFLMLSSASIDLLKQSGETLATRIANLETD